MEKAVKQDSFFSKFLDVASFILVVVFLVCAVAITSCSMGLGAAIDLVGPTVTLSSPTFRENVQEFFDITGTAQDNLGIKTLTVQIISTSNSENIYSEWKNENGTWLKKTSSGYVTDGDSIWNTGENGNVSWSVKNARIAGEDSGAYVIEVTSVDIKGNTSAGSKVTQPIVMDKKAPAIQLASPGAAFKTLANIKEELDGVDDYRSRDKLKYFLNDNVTVSGITDEENTIKYVLVEVYKQGTPDIRIKDPVRLIQDQSERKDPSDILLPTLRTWSLELSKDFLQTERGLSGKNYLYVRAAACDNAGNGEDSDGNPIYSNLGYFCYWPESGKPWLTLDTGTSENPKMLYANDKIRGQAFDDSCIKSIDYEIRKGSPSGEIVDSGSCYKWNEGMEELTYREINIPLPEKSGIYIVNCSVKDKSDVSSELQSGYIRVQDITFPTLDIEGPEKDKTLFGDSSGNINFKLTAKDDNGITSVKCAYIVREEDRITYSSSGETKWNKVTSSSAPYLDLNGNILFYIDVTENGVDTSIANIVRKKYNGTFQKNLFTDFGLNGTEVKLTNQNFIFRVEDNNSNASIYDYTAMGDIENPVVSVTKIEYNGKTYYPGAENLPVLLSSKPVTIYGTFSDDSIKAWGNSEKIFKSVIANGKNLPVNLNIVSEGNGTWEALYENPQGSSISISAVFTDFAGNSRKAAASYLIEADLPALQYISARENDGIYGIGTTFNILMRFNKKIILTKGTDWPKLKLNIGNAGSEKYALLHDVDGVDVSGTSMEGILLNYQYTVEAGDDVDKLDVTQIIENGCTFKAESGTDASISFEDRGLGDNKEIQIVTAKPAVTAVNYTDGKLNITFNKNISRNSGKIIITQKETETEKFLAPVVLSESDFLNYKKAVPEIENFYSIGTNGADSNFKPILTPKYILNYEKDADDETLTGYLKDSKIALNKVEIDIKSSSDILIEDNVISVDLTGLNGHKKLPCKGVTYTVEIPENLVLDNANFTNAEKTEEIYFDDVEEPVIRIQKQKFTFDDNEKTATQPLKANVKIDCRTPGVTFDRKYVVYKKGESYIKSHGHDNWSKSNATISQAAKDGGTPVTPDSNTFEIGTDNWYEGLEYQITVKVSKTAGRSAKEAEAKDSLFRTTISCGVAYNTNNDNIYTNFYGKTNNQWGRNEAAERPDLRMWIRGSDVIQGSNVSQSLPLSWNLSAMNETALCTMLENYTYNNNARNVFYYVTWDINVNKFYFLFLAGLTDKDSGTMGPYKCCYSQNNWASGYSDYYVSAGEYLYIDSNDTNTDFHTNEPGKIKTIRDKSN